MRFTVRLTATGRGWEGALRRVRGPLPYIVTALGLLGAVAPAAAQPPELAELVRAHADAAALAALDRMPAGQRGTPRLRYLRARLLDRLGRFAEAADGYPTGAGAAALPGAIQRDAARRRAVALARAGRCDAAREALRELGRHPLAHARMAECALSAGDLGTAVTELREVVQRGARVVDLVAARLALAEALARQGQRDDAIGELTTLVVERPEHPEAALAWSALEALRGEPVALSFDRRLRRAERFRQVRRPLDALTELDTVGRPTERAELRRWLHVRGMALYDHRRRYAEAAEVLAESARLGGPHAADDQFHAARALSRADRDLEAVAGYRQFAADHPGHDKAPEALYLASWLELRHRVPGAEGRMQRFVRSPQARRDPVWMREGLWQLALRAFERRQYPRAAELFAAYAATDAQTLVRARGLYWLGRARQGQHDRRGALAAYRDAMRVEPLHWYALLARQRIVELGEDPGPPFPLPPEEGEGPSASVQLPEEVRLLLELGLHHDARDALGEHEGAIRSAGGLPALVAAYTAVESPSRVRRLASSAAFVRSGHTPGPRDRWRWEAAYPRPWASRVETAAQAAGLEPAHVYAVMWQESAFDPDAISYADAIGLMQLLPSTARRMAEQLGVELTRDMLFDPAVNIQLGTAYVGSLASRYGVPLCFAGFNAGGHRVQAWLAAQGEVELDLFVERIPFTQTRNYTRRVTSHLAHYLYLEHPERGWPLELPRTVAPR
jgi:soluble lytic murein transglycosylase